MTVKTECNHARFATVPVKFTENLQMIQKLQDLINTKESALFARDGERSGALCGLCVCVYGGG